MTNDEIAGAVIAGQGHPLGHDFTIAVQALHTLAADLPDPKAKAVIGSCLQQLLRLQADAMSDRAASSRTRSALGHVFGG